jgi:hypothetical protein
VMMALATPVMMPLESKLLKPQKLQSEIRNLPGQCCALQRPRCRAETFAAGYPLASASGSLPAHGRLGSPTQLEIPTP